MFLKEPMVEDHLLTENENESDQVIIVPRDIYVEITGTPHTTGSLLKEIFGIFGKNPAWKKLLNENFNPFYGCETVYDVKDRGSIINANIDEVKNFFEVDF